MAQVLAVVNQKGGVGKSTTAQVLGNGLRHRGHSVLFVDLDPQGNLTYGMGIDVHLAEGSSYDLLTRSRKPKDCVTASQQGDLIASSPALAGLDTQLQNELGKEYRLKEGLGTFSQSYDFIVIDTPPTLSTVVINALTAANKVIIPTQADIYSLQGLGQLASTLQVVQQYTNPDVKIAGILVTRFDKRAVLTRQLTEMLKKTAEQLQTVVFTSTIREAIAVKEAQAMRTDLLEYAPKANVVADINGFLDELEQQL